MKIFRKLQKSIFIKLIIVLVITGLLVNLLVMAYHIAVYGPKGKNAFHRHLDNYIAYIIRDLGDPPSLKKAKAISRKLSVQIRFEKLKEANGKDISWATNNSMALIQDIKYYSFRHNNRHSKAKIGWYKGNNYIITANDSGKFVFMSDFHQFLERREEIIVLLILFLSLILLGAYLVIRRILKPVRWLSDGVREISKGNLDHVIPDNRRDELGELASSFNSMTKKIREMISARDQLLLDVSHELRSPLTRAKVALEMVNDTSKTRGIKEDMQEMEKMISEILETERLDFTNGRLNLEKVDLYILIKEAAKEFEGREPGINIIEPQKELFLRLDRARIRSVFKNLLDNSFKYSEKDSEPIKINFEEFENHINMIFQDHGIGIPQEDLPFIFEPFYRVDRSRSKKTGGYGLGLGLCKKIMRAHNGSIEAKSDSNGTSFYLKFMKG